MSPVYRIIACLALLGLAMPATPAMASGPLVRMAAGPAAEKAPAEDKAGEPELTAAQKMQKRFPQPVRVGDLIGLPVLDDDDSTLGYVRQVVQTPEGKIILVVPYRDWFGWLRTDWGKRPVAVPIEVVAILARQLNAVDMSRDDFDDAPVWKPSQGQAIAPDEKILIALGRR